MAHIKTSRLILPSSMDYLHPVIVYGSELARQAGFNRKEVLEISLALEESFANVVQHALVDDEDAQFEVIFEQSLVGLTIIIREKGLPFDPEKITQYAPDKASLDMDTRGLGNFLVGKAVNEVHFNNLGKDGKEIKLIKYLSHQRIDRHPGVSESEIVSPDSGKKRDAKNFIVRLLKTDETIEAAKCAYKSYGYSYVDYVYYPERLAQMIDDGRLISVVAVTDDGDFMGYGDWEFAYQGAPIAEASSILVCPEFRHTRAAFRIMKALVEQAKLTDMLYGHAYCVTGHTISQKGAALFGGVDTGLLLGMLPADLEFRELVETGTQRESVVLTIFPFKHSEPKTIFPPVAHYTITSRICQALGSPDMITDCSDKSFDVSQLQDQCQIELEQSPDINSAIIKIRKYGVDVLEEIRRQLHACCVNKIDVIYVYLDLEDELTAYLTPEFEKMGFFFAGIFPLGLHSKTALILQYLNNIEIDFDLIHVNSPLAHELLEYVRQAIKPWYLSNSKELPAI